MAAVLSPTDKPPAPDHLAMASFGTLVGNATRAHILTSLMEHSPQASSALAKSVGSANSTTSEHLVKLVEAGLLRSRRCGRHKMYEFASTEALDLVVALAASWERRPI